MTVRELLSRIDSHELSEWIAYQGIEPFGEERADLRSGIIAAVTANAWRGKGDKAMSPQDFMPFYEKPEPVRSPEREQTLFHQINEAIKRRKR